MKKLDTQMIVMIALVAAGLLVGAAGYFAVVAPQQSKASKIDAQIGTVQSELTVAEGSAARPVPFHASNLFQLADAMPASNDMPGILIGLSHLADQSKVKLTSVRPTTSVPLTLGYSALPITVTITGNYRTITKFLHLVRRNVRMVGGTQLRVGGRLFDTDNIALAQGQVGDQLNATLQLVAFVYTGVGLTPVGATSDTGSTTTTTTTSGA